jgi:hypothetical protein
MIAEMHYHKDEDDQAGTKAGLSDRLVGEDCGSNLDGHRILIWKACSQTN